MFLDVFVVGWGGVWDYWCEGETCVGWGFCSFGMSLDEGVGA